MDELFRDQHTKAEERLTEAEARFQNLHNDALIWVSEFIKTTAGDMLQQVTYPGHSSKSKVFFLIRNSDLIQSFATTIRRRITDAAKLCDRVATALNHTVHCTDLEELKEQINHYENLFLRYETLATAWEDQHVVIQGRTLFENKIKLRQQEGVLSFGSLGNLARYLLGPSSFNSRTQHPRGICVKMTKGEESRRASKSCILGGVEIRV